MAFGLASMPGQLLGITYLCLVKIKVFRAQGFFLLMLFMMQTFSGLLIYSDYLINKKYIATVLCENREMPERKCDGKCYLRKQLQEHHEEKKAPVSSREVKKEISIFFWSVEPKECMKHIEAKVFSDCHCSIFSEKHVDAVFQPPLCRSGIFS
jgi:hypothetical protein